MVALSTLLTALTLHAMSNVEKTAQLQYVEITDTSATCALYNGNHPANYKVCTVYKELQNRRRQPSSSTNFNQKH